MARRQHLTLMVGVAVLGLFTLMYLMAPAGSLPHYPLGDLLHHGQGKTEAGATDFGSLASSILTGKAIAPKLENATAK